MTHLLEVESKFLVQHHLLPLFRSNKGSPPFSRLKHLRTYSFHDTYYDEDDVLSKNGIWIRARVNGLSKTLEAKRRVSGNFTRSTFEEITDAAKIRSLVREYLPTVWTEQENIDLSVLAQFTTSREQYLADEKFSIILDQTNFGHSVGEVELETQDSAQAHHEIDDFLKRYSWFFHGGPVDGKLSAYFKMRNGARMKSV